MKNGSNTFGQYTFESVKRQNRFIKFCSISSVLGLLSACGGGGSTSSIDNSSDDSHNDDVSSYKPSLKSLAHEVNGTTHFTGLSSLVTGPYEGYPTFINGDFDFTNLEIDYSNFDFSSEKSPSVRLSIDVAAFELFDQICVGNSVLLPL